MIEKLIGAGVALFIGFALVGPIQETTMQISQNDSIGYANTILIQSVPVFFLLAVLGMGILVAWAGLRGTEEDDEELPEIPESKPHHKQTYEEYVQERLRVEREMAR